MKSFHFIISALATLVCLYVIYDIGWQNGETAKLLVRYMMEAVKVVASWLKQLSNILTPYAFQPN